MIRRSRCVLAAITCAFTAGFASVAAANPVVSVRVTDGSSAFDLGYAASASALGGFVTSDNAPLVTIPRGTTDAFAVTSASARAIAGELIYRAAGDSTRECRFRYTVTYTGTRYAIAVDARASWTGDVKCTATFSGLDKAKGDVAVAFTMQ